MRVVCGFFRRGCFAALGLLVAGSLFAPAVCRAAEDLPAYRIESEGFEAREADIRAVLDSVIRELWRFFPDYQLEPMVVTRGYKNPITLYERNDQGEIVIRLNTRRAYWCQYAYQFAHELCHVLCGFDKDWPGNKWFEETLCETASLFVLRAMARTWKDRPPYPNWRNYRDALRDYADDVIRKRQYLLEIYKRGLPAFYRAHERRLRSNPCDRELNGAMAVVLLELLERQPEHWEAVRWLNSAPSPPGETFQQYLQRWYDAVPARHKPFVVQVARLYGMRISAPETAGTR